MSDHPTPPWRSDRRALVRIGASTLHQMLDLPDDVHITGLTADFASMAVVVSLASNRFEPVSETREAPLIGSEITTKVHLVTPSHGDSDHPVEPPPATVPFFRIEIDLPEAPSE